jgi:hypothetical protein
VNARSSAYSTSSAVTSRSTGGLNLTPFLMSTVIRLSSFEISHGPAARSGVGGWAVCSGLYE